jgi:hypothetical protein
MAKTSAPVRLNIILPADLVADLRAQIPVRRRSKFIAEAVREQLDRLRFNAAVAASFGAWADADHPDMADGPAIDRWIASHRARPSAEPTFDVE